PARGLATSHLRELRRRPRGLRRWTTPSALEQLGQHALADLDHTRVELRPCAFVEPTNGFLSREPLAVRPVGRHRVIRVANEDDPRLDRNVLALPTVGVPGPVVALVAVADDRPHLLQPVDRGDDPLPQLRMLLDDLPLVVRERPGLGPD